MLCLAAILLSATLAVAAPKPAAPAAAAAPQQREELITDIRIIGNRRIPAETVRARMFTKAGDVFDPVSLERDFASIWNTGYFEDIRFEREETPKGVRLNVYVKEKPTIREIKYIGLNSVSQSDVLDRFKERKVGLTVENQYDPTKVKRAEVTIRELLAEHGRQFATIRTEVHPIPPAAVGVNFVVKEGPKVKVGKIRIEGNKKVGSKTLVRAMKNSHPIGIPHSIVLESLFHKTFDATKLSEDAERVRMAYQDRGYFKALVQEPTTKIRDTGGGFRIWPFGGKGKAVDITVPVEEGERFRLGQITFKNNKAVTNTAGLRKLFQLKDGDVFNRTAIAKGLDNLRKAYGELGYINFTSVPNTEIDDDKRLINLEIDVDEGKQYSVRRIEFKGNTTTRDKVIRRELALEEGQVYNSRAWEFSVLRLNQLNYFEALKPDQDTETKRNDQAGTVDLTLKVKEKGKNSIGLTGGVSGLAGSFIGLNYQTNNFLGLGETLTIQADVGNRQRDLLFGFTEPYLFDRPLQLGFTVYTRRYNFDQAQQFNILAGQRLNFSQSFLNTLQNYTQSSTGFTVSASYPLHRSLKRVGLTYALDNTSITTFSDASRDLFEQLAFRNFAGPNALKGVVTSKLLPVFSYNSVDRSYNPHSGKSLFLSADISGIGGNVASIRPVVDFKHFIPLRLFKPDREGRNVLGYHVQGAFLTGYAGKVAPPFERFYLGGENDLRGFDIRSVSPVAFLVDKIDFPLINPDDPCATNPATQCTGVLKDPTNPRRGTVTVPIPVHRIVFPGGDTSIVGNVEYRIPIAGPVNLAIFTDLGLNFITRSSQLRVNEDQLNTLNTSPFGCPTFDATFNCVGTSSFTFGSELKPISGTNYRPRMSTGVELQVLMPVINAPFRLYWAYNPLRLDTLTTTPSEITRSMFPAGGAGDFTYHQALATWAPNYRLKEPLKTFRFTVSTTF
ncbi:MAG TPA: outer membrane protein assembly factor BamA [Terriglobales bacterium]|nr:outer membrane protein assembly factor BamA [Terriglobales bacterium]